ncbi:MAG: hypothetical protein H0U06_01660 [Solirubrobacterales bacterium]|nr:hypothetical protein [Solirubrobacterales bacterium]
MSEHENDSFYWEPSEADDLRQGDLLFNVPIALMPQRPRFVLGEEETVETQTFDDYPENAPSDLIIVEAHFGVLGMVGTPTCHVSEGEKDQDVVAVVPVQSLNLVTGDITKSRSIRDGKNVPLHVFHLPPTDLGGGILRFHGAALLDRPASMLKDNLRDYRRLGLYIEARIKLRKALARFWARGSADNSIDESMAKQFEHRPLEDLE